MFHWSFSSYIGFYRILDWIGMKHNRVVLVV